MITVENLHVQLGGRELLSDVSFQAAAGQVTGLIGPNGAGKSTLLGVVAGDVAPASGVVRIAGVDPYSTRPQELARLRAVMLQDVGVAFDFSVRDVVAMGRRPWEDTSDDERIITAALRAVSIAHLAQRSVMTLSGGERARVALARVLAQRTPVLILDEPTAALDIKHQEQVLGLVRSLAHDAGVAVLLVVHDLNAAAAYCDHIVCLAAGQVTAVGTVAEVYTPELLSQVYGWPIAVSTAADGMRQVNPQRRFDTADFINDWKIHQL